MHDPQPLTCSAEEQRLLLDLARDSIEAALLSRQPSWPEEEALSDTLRTPAATFVTLHREGHLRGCVGTLTPRDPLYRSVATNAVGAALRDTRFQPVTREESKQLALHVSVLSPLVPIHAESVDERLAQISPGKDGVVLRFAGRMATFLPQVWDTFPDTISFLEALSRKAGHEARIWQEAGAELSRYRVAAFGDTIH